MRFKFLLITLFFFLIKPVLANEIMDDVIALLDTQGELRTGVSENDGYYVVVLSYSNLKNESKAKEHSRLASLKLLTEFLLGTHVEESSHLATKYSIEDKEGVIKELSKESLAEVVKSQFHGDFSSVKVIKQGLYKGKYFTAIAITEKNTKQKSSQITTAETEQRLLSNSKNRTKTVQAKGFSSSKKGSIDSARKSAINDALKNAVQQANGIEIKGKNNRIGNVVTMAVSSKSQGYIRTYEIIDEYNIRGEYAIELVAEIDQAKLINDVGFFTDVFSSATFAVLTSDNSTRIWFTKQLDNLGFVLQNDTKTASHLFKISFKQNTIQNHLGVTGIETIYSIILEDKRSSELLFSVTNEAKQSRVYVAPISRAKQVSKTAALKSIQKLLAPEIIQSLAKASEKGLLYQLVVSNARRIDLRIFKDVFNSKTKGYIEEWQWNKNKKTLTLSFRYPGVLSDALDEGLEGLYSAYKIKDENRQVTTDKVSKYQANFTINSK